MGAPSIGPRTNLAVVAVAVAAAAVIGASVVRGVIEVPMFAGLVLAAALALVVIPPAIYLSYRLGMLDHPDDRKFQKEPVPLLGGPGVLVAFGAALLVCLYGLSQHGGWSVAFSAVRTELLAMLAAGAFIVLIGVVDDRWGLKPGVRLIGQLAAVSVVMRYGVVMSFLPRTGAGRTGEIVLTVIWLVGMTNAMNFLDGLDGLAAGLTAVAALSFAVITAMTGQIAVTTASLCLAGATLGFLRHNVRPASIYLGDSGATLLGFTLACIAIIGDWGTGPTPTENLFVPLIVLGIPIYDVIYITVHRYRAGLIRSLSDWATYVGHDHLHHRLLRLGMRPGPATLFICLGGAALGVLAVILQTKGELDRYDKFLALVLAIIFFVGVTVLMELGKNSGDTHEPHDPPA